MARRGSCCLPWQRTRVRDRSVDERCGPSIRAFPTVRETWRDCGFKAQIHGLRGFTCVGSTPQTRRFAAAHQLARELERARGVAVRRARETESARDSESARATCDPRVAKITAGGLVGSFFTQLTLVPSVFVSSFFGGFGRKWDSPANEPDSPAKGPQLMSVSDAISLSSLLEKEIEYGRWRCAQPKLRCFMEQENAETLAILEEELSRVASGRRSLLARGPPAPPKVAEKSHSSANSARPNQSRRGS